HATTESAGEHAGAGDLAHCLRRAPAASRPKFLGKRPPVGFSGPCRWDFGPLGPLSAGALNGDPMAVRCQVEARSSSPAAPGRSVAGQPMKLSRPSTYALHALVDLANRGGSEAVGAREIAWAYGISEHLLSMALR